MVANDKIICFISHTPVGNAYMARNGVKVLDIVKAASTFIVEK